MRKIEPKEIANELFSRFNFFEDRYKILHVEQDKPKTQVNIVIAGFLHDIIEDTDVTEQNICEDFGVEVAKMVIANTKNTAITEKKIRNDELIKRCLETSEKASIVKAADILDNYKYYLSLNDQVGIEYCKNNALSFGKYFNNDYKDKIFTKLFEAVVQIAK